MPAHMESLIMTVENPLSELVNKTELMRKERLDRLDMKSMMTYWTRLEVI